MNDVPSFGEYLQRQIDHRDDLSTVSDLARVTGIPQANLSRWMRGQSMPNAANFRELAEALGRPVLEVIVAAGLVTPEEVGRPLTAPSLDALSDDELLRELRHRLASAARADSDADLARDPSLRAGVVRPAERVAANRRRKRA